MMIAVKAFRVFALILVLFAVGFAQSASQTASLMDWREVPAGFVIERLFLNPDDESWMQERAQLAHVGSCGMYDRYVLKYVGDPGQVPVELGQPLHALYTSLGNDVNLFDASEHGFLWASAVTHTVVDVDLYFGMVSPGDLMVRYEITMCRANP